jgi:hypothetical protein
MLLRYECGKTTKKRLSKNGWESWQPDINKHEVFYKKIRGEDVKVRIFDDKTIAFVDDHDWWIPELWFLIALCDELKKLEEN